VDKSVNTSAAHVRAFCETKSLCKTQSVTLTYFFAAQTVTIGSDGVSGRVSSLGLEGFRSRSLSLETLHRLFFMNFCKNELLKKRF